MKFISLVDPEHSASLEEALQRGLPPDGSLYYPEFIPQLTDTEIKSLQGQTLQEVAHLLLSKWTDSEIPDKDLMRLINNATTFDTPIRQVGDKQILELFHGPTMAFKDVAARYLAGLMGYFNQKRGDSSIVLVATSGDTGGAIAHGFADVPNTSVVVLFPKGRVSDLQRLQLTRTASNITSLEVDGSFDDCQSLVKQAFLDQSLTGLNLTSANSISIGRLLPQMIYYAYTYGQLNSDKLRFVVPTGNLGNLSAGALCRAMGVPIHSFLAASNNNDAVTRYINNADASFVETKQTLATAMDVGLPNNLPRLKKIFGNDIDKLRATVTASSITDQEIVDTIKKVYADTGYLLDPHTAVGWAASIKNPSHGLTDVIIATAAPEKFAKEIQNATGITVDNSASLKALQNLPEKVSSIDSNYESFNKYLIGQSSLNSKTARNF